MDSRKNRSGLLAVFLIYLLISVFPIHQSWSEEKPVFFNKKHQKRAPQHQPRPRPTISEIHHPELRNYHLKTTYYLKDAIGSVTIEPVSAVQSATTISPIKRSLIISTASITLFIQTTPDLPPMLEGFNLSNTEVNMEFLPLKSASVTVTIKNNGQRGKPQVSKTVKNRFINFKRVDGGVSVTFLKPLFRYLHQPTTIHWVDYYR